MSTTDPVIPIDGSGGTSNGNGRIGKIAVAVATVAMAVGWTYAECTGVRLSDTFTWTVAALLLVGAGIGIGPLISGGGK